MCFLLLLMFSLISFNVIDLVSTNIIQIKCDFKLYKNGCEDSVGSVCDPVLKQCVCREDYTIRLSNGVCLLPKMIGDDCTTSSQCLVKNSACYSKDVSLKQWKCQCSPEFYLKTEPNEEHNTKPIQTCEQRLSFGQNCINSDQCSEQLFCSQLEGKCVCEQDFHYDLVLKKCVHQNYTKCEDTHEWSHHLKKCVQKVHYSHRGSSGGGAGARSGTGGRDSGSKGWYGGKSSAQRVKCYANIYFLTFSLFTIILLNNKQNSITINF